MAGLVLFLHGLRGNRHSWGAVPSFVQRSPLGQTFKVASLEYSAGVFSSARIATSAQQVLTQIETRYAACDPIYLVGHSLGGLIAREICRQLLLNDPDSMLSKIGGVITVGTPLEGAPIANWFLGHTGLVSPKIRELTKNHFDNYQDAILEAIKRSAKRPKHFHIAIENDMVISSHVASHFTEDDYPAGVIPGSHRNFANNNKDASYVADVLVTQIRKSQNSMSASEIRKIDASETEIRKASTLPSHTLPDRLILISCSHTKHAGGDAIAEAEPAAWIPSPHLRQRVINKRSYVFSVLADAKLEDGFLSGNNRKHQPTNQNLIHGPDLGGVGQSENPGAYLPAWQRYGGRFYVPVSQQAWGSYLQNRQRLRVLIMSGLYGLIEPEERIQNYDVHLTDTHRDTGHSVASMWSELYTEMLNNYISYSYTGRKVHILNLLCDTDYVDSILWHKLSPNCSVFHLASPTLANKALLPPAGTIFDAILREPDRFDTLQRGIEFDISSFGRPPDGLSGTQLIFDRYIGESKKVEPGE
jgi:pimeloyl-ACP methyl ester carboxylesterase